MVTAMITIRPMLVTDDDRQYVFGDISFYRRLGFKVEPTVVHHIEALELMTLSNEQTFCDKQHLHFHLHDKCPHGYRVLELDKDYYLVEVFTSR